MSEGKIKSYIKSFEKYDGGIRSLQWVSYKAAAVRFVNLVEDIEFNNKSVLDVGCGFGDLIPFITSRALHFKYTGIDLLHEFTDEAQKRYPDYEFITGDYFTKRLGKFDVICCSGALNGRSANVMEDRKAKIKNMFNKANDALVFNMAGGYKVKNSEKSKVYYADSSEILEYCLTLTSRIIFKQHYHNKDFTIALFK